MLTPSEAEAAWAAKNGPRVQAGGAKTAPTALVDESADSGLSDAQVEPVHQHHQLLLNNNDQAA
jgi:hypothetical protein